MILDPHARLRIQDKLGDDWRRLATFLEIPAYDIACFEQGDEGRRILIWLENHNRLSDLPAALQHIGRADLLPAVTTPTSPAQLAALMLAQTVNVDLDTRFVRLTLLLDQGKDAPVRFSEQPQRFDSLPEALAARTEPALVVLGPPGAGKSTLLRHYQRQLARDLAAAPESAPVPFFVALGAYPAGTGPAPRQWLAEYWRTTYGEGAADFESLLWDQRLVLLLDALNEVPHQRDEHIRLWRRFLEELVQQRPGNRVVFSCRRLDYVASLSREALTVPMLRVEALDDEQVQAFLKAYDGPDWEVLRVLPQLKLFRLPFYLKLLCGSKEIPSGRAALLTRMVRQAVVRELERENPLFDDGDLLDADGREKLSPAGLWRDEFELPGGTLFEALEQLAVHLQGERHGEDANAQVRLAREAVLAVLGEDGRRLLEAGCALNLLERDEGDTVRFAHQLLQEYFAAQHFARALEPGRLAVEWRASAVCPGLEETLAELADSDPLPLLPNTGWEETALLAAAMAREADGYVAGLMDVNLPLAGRAAAQPDVAVSAELRERLGRALVKRSRGGQADLRARIAAGLALGELGDPRFERRTGPEGDEFLLPPMVLVPGGRYWIGSEEGHYADEAPVHGVEISGFRIGQFPVTNAEWACFMAAEGYEDERWWETEEARAWRRKGSSEEQKMAHRNARRVFQNDPDKIDRFLNEGKIHSQEAETWRWHLNASDSEFEDQLDEWYPEGRLTQPANWANDSYNNPAQPVVGICRYEAQAYCAWLSAQTGQTYRLPTEVEWEAAARGDGSSRWHPLSWFGIKNCTSRRFAYGNRFDPARCNTVETHLQRTSPIGIFPGGDTPSGIVDLTGNVSEWTSSLYKPYPYNSTDGRESASSGEGRWVLRGGSWGGDSLRARATCRYHAPPITRRDNRGMRLACSAIIS